MSKKRKNYSQEFKLMVNERIQKSLGYLTPMQYKQKEMERIKKEKVLQ